MRAAVPLCARRDGSPRSVTSPTFGPTPSSSPLFRNYSVHDGPARRRYYRRPVYDDPGRSGEMSVSVGDRNRRWLDHAIRTVSVSFSAQILPGPNKNDNGGAISIPRPGLVSPYSLKRFRLDDSDTGGLNSLKHFRSSIFP